MITKTKCIPFDLWVKLKIYLEHLRQILEEIGPQRVMFESFYYLDNTVILRVFWVNQIVKFEEYFCYKTAKFEEYSPGDTSATFGVCAQI